MITCNTAIQQPRVKSVILNTPYPGKIAKPKEATPIIKKEADNKVLSLYFSDKNPAGMDIIPYAIKNVNGKNPVEVRLKSKLSLTSTIIEFRMLVMNDITKNTNITSPTK